MTLAEHIAHFMLHATPAEREDAARLLPALLGRRARQRAQHAADQREAPTTRQASVDGQLASILRDLTPVPPQTKTGA